MTDATRAVAARALACLDLTSLNDADTEARVAPLYAKASGDWGHVAALCVWPRIVPYARKRFEGTGVKVATVVNFPHGRADFDVAEAETRAALAYGAEEVDMVFPYTAFLAGDEETPERLVARLKAVCGGAVALKVILESGALLTRPAIARASRIAIAGGADFLKTSTGKSRISATLEAADAILTAIRDSGAPVGFKASGGIRSYAQARAYLALADGIMGPGWAGPATFRFGASGLADALAAAWRGDAARPAEGAY